MLLMAISSSKAKAYDITYQLQNMWSDSERVPFGRKVHAEILSSMPETIGS